MDMEEAASKIGETVSNIGEAASGMFSNVRGLAGATLRKVADTVENADRDSVADSANDWREWAEEGSSIWAAEATDMLSRFWNSGRMEDRP